MDYGNEIILRPEDGEFTFPRGRHHRLYTCPSDGPDGQHEEVRVLLSGEQTESAHKLDFVFFENWYAYQERIVSGGERVDLVQVLSVSFPLCFLFPAKVLGGDVMMADRQKDV